MSLLSTDAAVLLLPGRAFMRHGGRVREVACGTGWDGALDGLASLSKEKGPVRGARVALSHHFASPHVFAPPPMRLNGDEMQGWLRERLGQDFGVEAETWRLAWQDTPPGRPVPAATLTAERHDALMACLDAMRIRLRHLNPWFVSAWGRHHRALGQGGAWLALVEPGRLALARVEKGRPIHLGMSRLEADSALSLPAQVAAAVTRQALHLGVPEAGEVCLLAPSMAVEGGLPGSSLRLRLLDGGAGWGGLLS